jgi:hypothetical protein
VSATVLSPGVVATEFLQVAGQTPTRYQRRSRADSPTVARIGVGAMLKGRPSLVAGWRNAAAAWSVRLLPRRTAAALAYAPCADPLRSARGGQDRSMVPRIAASALSVSRRSARTTSAPVAFSSSTP